MHVNSFEAICLMAEAGIGLGIVPALAARRYARSMKIAAVTLSEPWAAREHHVIVRRGRKSPQYLCDLVEAICTLQRR